MDIIFAKTRYKYDSYTDFWKLVELSGFETCYVDEIDLAKPRVYITSPMNGELPPHMANQTGKPHNAHLIHWCLERPSGAGGVYNYGKSNRARIYDRTLDEVWVSDRAMASETMLRFVVCGSDYGLGEPSPDKLYDFCHMSYATDRRQRVYNYFDPKTVGPNCWPWDTKPSRDYVLKHSRFALNVHQDQYPFQEPLRWALFAAYGLPMLTEEVKDAYPWHENVCVFNPYDGIQSRLLQMLNNDYQRWWDMGMQARERLCGEFNFRKMVLQAVKESVG
jgi:hypothetical protein